MTGGSRAANLAAPLPGRPARRGGGGKWEPGGLLWVAVKRRGDALGSEAEIDRQWRDLAYTARPELAAATLEYQRFLALLTTAGGGGPLPPPPPAPRPPPFLVSAEPAPHAARNASAHRHDPATTSSYPRYLSLL